LTNALIGMGSNIDPAAHLRQAAEALRAQFGVVRFSNVYRSAAVGMDGDDFYNACCLIETEMTQSALRDWLKGQEDRQGRDRSAGSWKPRTIDLDILIYGDAVVDDELYRYAHAFVPAAELLPELAARDQRSDQSLTLIDLRL